jgi:hypothetical protein
MKIVKIQHKTSLFHSRKRHSTFCLGTRKARLPIFLGTIVKFHCLVLIWVQLSPHLFSTHVLGYGWKFVNLFHLKNVSSTSIYGFYTFFSKGCHHFLAFPTSLLYSWLFKKIYLTIIDSKWFFMCQDNSLFDVFLGYNVNH